MILNAFVLLGPAFVFNTGKTIVLFSPKHSTASSMIIVCINYIRSVNESNTILSDYYSCVFTLVVSKAIQGLISCQSAVGYNLVWIDYMRSA